MSETRKYRKFTAQQKTGIVLTSLRGPKTMTELCREHDIADSLLRKLRRHQGRGASGGHGFSVGRHGSRRQSA